MAKCKKCVEKVSWVTDAEGKWKLVNGKYPKGTKFDPENQKIHWYTCPGKQAEMDAERERRENMTPYQKAPADKRRAISGLKALLEELYSYGATPQTTSQFMRKKTIDDLIADPKCMTPAQIQKAEMKLREQLTVLKKVRGEL